MPLDVSLLRTEDGMKMLRASCEARGTPLAKLDECVELDQERRKVWIDDSIA